MIQALLCIQRRARALVQGSTYNMSCYPDCEHHVDQPDIVHFWIAYISRGCGLYMAAFMNSSGKSLHSAHAVYDKCSNIPEVHQVPLLVYAPFPELAAIYILARTWRGISLSEAKQAAANLYFCTLLLQHDAHFNFMWLFVCNFNFLWHFIILCT